MWRVLRLIAISTGHGRTAGLSTICGKCTHFVAGKPMKTDFHQ